MVCFAEALGRAEELANIGEVDQAHMLQQQADAYNKQHEDMFKRLTTPEKTMLVRSPDGFSRYSVGMHPIPVKAS